MSIEKYECYYLSDTLTRNQSKAIICKELKDGCRVKHMTIEPGDGVSRLHVVFEKTVDSLED